MLSGAKATAECVEGILEPAVFLKIDPQLPTRINLHSSGQFPSGTSCVGKFRSYTVSFLRITSMSLHSPQASDSVREPTAAMLGFTKNCKTIHHTTLQYTIYNKQYTKYTTCTLQLQTAITLTATIDCHYIYVYGMTLNNCLTACVPNYPHIRTGVYRHAVRQIDKDAGMPACFHTCMHVPTRGNANVLPQRSIWDFPKLI